MRTAPPAPSKQTYPFEPIWRMARDVLIVALLAWIGFNLHVIRKSANAPAPPQTATTATTETAPPPVPPTRGERIAGALAATPQGIRFSAGVLESIRAEAPGVLERVAVEIFLRRNGCHPRTEAVDGRFSAAEQRAIRSCAPLTRERLVTRDGAPHAERAVAWLERSL